MQFNSEKDKKIFIDDDMRQAPKQIEGKNGFYWRIAANERIITDGMAIFNHFNIHCHGQCSFIDCIPEDLVGGDEIAVEGTISVGNKGMVFLNASSVTLVNKTKKKRSVKW